MMYTSVVCLSCLLYHFVSCFSSSVFFFLVYFFFFKQKTAYEMRISDWSSDVCSSDLKAAHYQPVLSPEPLGELDFSYDLRDHQKLPQLFSVALRPRGMSEAAFVKPRPELSVIWLSHACRGAST